MIIYVYIIYFIVTFPQDEYLGDILMVLMSCVYQEFQQYFIQSLELLKGVAALKIQLLTKFFHTLPVSRI